MIEALPPSRNPNPPQNVLVDQNHSRFGKHQQRQPHTLDQQEHEHRFGNQQQLRKEKNLSNYLDIGGEDDYEQQFEFLPKTCKAIEVNSILESGCLRYDTTHKLWGMLNLKVNKNLSRNIAAVDFVVVVDISASMILDKKLAFVKLSIHYLLDLLNENHRLALVFFNHDVSFASKLAYCTNEKKKEFIDILEKIQASGSTNISKALFTGNKILLDRDESTRDRISTLMLITDGLSNIGLTSEETLTSLNSLSLPSGCVFHTFGIGEDHDSCLLNSISSKTKGVYYYISSSDHIHKIFGGCIQSLLTSRVRFIDILLQAQDGCRMISIATPFQTKEIEKAKEYSVNIGLMYSGEYKTILFRLSLRKMNKILLKHPLLKVCVQYLDVATGKVECIKTDLNIERREFSLDPTIPLLLDQNLNRYYAVTTILEAIEDCNRLQFSNAQKKLSDRIEAILLSSSGNLSYCNHLVNDLRECILGMQDVNSFQTGSHIAHSYASMYYMERSSGVEIKKSMSNIEGYGYLTEDQLTLQESYSLDQEKSNKLLSKYLHT